MAGSSKRSSRAGSIALARFISAALVGAGASLATLAPSHAQDVKNDTRTLPAVRVSADVDEPQASEGTGSYTTDSTSTATGLSLSLRETPQSVSIITRERMDDQAMTTAADALRNTTGVSLKPVDRGRNNLSVRGFEITSFQFDGVPVATGNVGIETTNTAIYDRIEIVRGATGLITGAGEPSAAINLVRKHANSDTFTGSIAMEAGSWDRRGATVDVSTPLNQAASVRGRVVANFAQRDAFIDLESTENTVFYGIIDADLSDRTVLSVGASVQRDERDGVLWAGLPYWYSDGTRIDWGRSRTSATRWNEWDTQERTAFVTLKHTFANQWSIRADASHYRQTEDSKLLWLWGVPDRETGEGMQAYPYHYLSEPKQTNVNLITTGPFQWLGREHELTAGLMYSRRKAGWTNRDVAPGAELAPIGDFMQWDGSYPEPQLGERFVGSMTTLTQSGIYAAARLQLSERLKVIGGGRVTNWRQQDDAGAWTASAFEMEHDGVFTPYAAAIYDLGAGVSAYASYTEIFLPDAKKDRNGNYLDPREGASYELGLKSEFLDGALNASAAVFYVDQDNFAVADVGQFVPGTLDPAYRTAQGVETEGYELELVGELTPDWNVSVGWTHYSAKDAEDQDVAVDHPRRLLKLFTKYALPGRWRGFEIGAGFSWESAKPARDVNPATGESERVGEDSYALAELLAKYTFSEQLSTQINVNNLFDEQYRSSSYWWGAPYTYGEPRNVLLSLDYNF
jgi:outer membrane receptor for ferric coprogen and ferric-rhodotorulic acid